MQSLNQIFWKYHIKNPQVYWKFEELTLYLIGKGRENYGAKSVFERMRWHFDMETKGDQFKINNSYVSRYARLFSDNNPQYSDFFKKRILKAGD